jgi:hypothetical protein
MKIIKGCLILLILMVFVSVGALFFRGCNERPTPTVTPSLEPTATFTPTLIENTAIVPTKTASATVIPHTPTFTHTPTRTPYIPTETEPPWITALPTEPYIYRPAPAMQLEPSSKRKMPKGW